MLLTLFEPVIVRADSAFEGVVANAAGRPDSGLWRNGIKRSSSDVRLAPRGLAGRRRRWRTNSDLRELWSRFMQKWIDHTAAVIESRAGPRRRAGDASRPTTSSTALNLMNERTMMAELVRRRRPSVPEDRVLETLVHIWVTSIYGEQV